MRRRFTVASAMVGALALITLAGCTTDPNVTAPSEDAAPPRRRSSGSTRSCTTSRTPSARSCPKGPRASRGSSTSTPRSIDTSEYASAGAKKACFANASISNPWRQTGWITMNQQLQVLQEAGVDLRDGDARRAGLR